MKTKDVSGPQLFLAVDDVRIELEKDGEGTGQEKWSYSEQYRRQLFNLVKHRYCERTGCKIHDFPFSVDAVSMANTRWRKESDKVAARTDLETQLALV